MDDIILWYFVWCSIIFSADLLNVFFKKITSPTLFYITKSSTIAIIKLSSINYLNTFIDDKINSRFYNTIGINVYKKTLNQYLYTKLYSSYFLTLNRKPHRSSKCILKISILK